MINGNQPQTITQEQYDDRFPTLRSFGDDASARNAYVGVVAGLDLNVFDPAHPAVTEAKGNIENPIGVIPIPLASVGPIWVRGEYAKGLYRAQYGTTEAALVSSVQKGSKLTVLAGGIETLVRYNGMTRGTMLECSNMDEVRRVLKFVHDPEQQEAIREISKGESEHTTLMDLETTVLGANVYLRFRFNTEEAMGMNNGTEGAKLASLHIAEGTGSKLKTESSNICSDKKPAMINPILGRGYDVNTLSFIPNALIDEFFGVTARQMAELCTEKNAHGSALAGSMAQNAHVANQIAAIYIATGQDPAHVVEASFAITTAKERGGGLQFAVKIPNILVGTIGGGTRLSAQQKAIELMLTNIQDPRNPSRVGENRSYQFAEIVGAAAHCGELALLGALTNGTLSSAHQRLRVTS